MSVSNALLGLLAYTPRHGYELHDAFEAMMGGKDNWDVKPAQVYNTLNRLAKKGLIAEEGVAQAGGPEKLVYAITDEGRDALEAWFYEPVTADYQRDAFFLKLMLALATEEANPIRVIYVQRASLYRELHGLNARRSEADPATELAHVLLMDQAVMRLEADLRWLEMVEARLDEIKRQPLPEPQERPRGRPKK